MLQWVLSTLNAVIPIAISTAKENAGNGGQNRIIPPIELIEPLGPGGGSAWSSGQTILNLGDSLIFAASQDPFVRFEYTYPWAFLASNMIPGSLQAPHRISL